MGGGGGGGGRRHDTSKGENIQYPTTQPAYTHSLPQTCSFSPNNVRATYPKEISTYTD